MKSPRHLMSAALVLTVTLSSVLFSCMEDPGTHLSQFIYPNSNTNPFFYGYLPVYADTPVDSIFFATTEQWKLRVDYFGGSEDWLTIDNDIKEPFFKMQENTIYYISGSVIFAPNTTGHKRYARISLGAAKYDCSAGFIQLPYLCVTRPMRYVITTSELSSMKSRDSLASLVSLADTPGDSIVFRVNDRWELIRRDNSWLHPAVTQGLAGSHSVQIAYDANMSDTERYDTLFLRTKGQNNISDSFIVDTIPFIQRAR